MTLSDTATPVLGAILAVMTLVSCGSPGAGEAVGTATSEIVGGTPATAYPEAVVVTSSYILPCSGVVLAPRVVLTAGHCRSSTKTYAITAPNASGQQVSGSSDWTTFDGSAATSSDTLLIFLDAPITLASYPVIATGEVASGTAVVDVGRTLNGVITTQLYVSPTVTIQGPGDPLGFPYNYEALPDISQDGDSGGPIELVAPSSSPHTVVAIVDTDTVEQNVTETSPIDLFARLDIVRDAIVAQIATAASSASAQDAGASTDAAPDGAARGDASAPDADAHPAGADADAGTGDAPVPGTAARATASSSLKKESCSLARARDPGPNVVGAGIAFIVGLGVTRRSRRRIAARPPRAQPRAALH